jgi:hypothetical protein
LGNVKILWYVDSLLGDSEIGDCTAVVARQRPPTIEEWFALYGKQQLNSNKGTVFSMRYVPRGKKDSYDLVK